MAVTASNMRASMCNPPVVEVPACVPARVNGLQIGLQKKKTGVIAPKRFIQRLKKDNELFRGYMHQVRRQPLPLSQRHMPAERRQLLGGARRQQLAARLVTVAALSLRMDDPYLHHVPGSPAHARLALLILLWVVAVALARQDAHEFLNFLLNEMVETLERDEKDRTQRLGTPAQLPIRTWVHDIFHGKLVNETRCMM